MSVFNEETTEPQENLFSSLVGEGKKFKDQEALAKGKLEADRFIEGLERQLSELKEDLSKNNHAKTLLEQLEQSKKVTTDTELKPVDTKTGVSEENLERLVEALISKREQTSTAQQNISETERKLEELYGTEAKNVVTEKAKAIGLSFERMQVLAGESPTAFLALIGNPESKADNLSVKGTINTSALNANTQSGDRDWAYYQELRKKNPSVYYSAKTQQQLIADSHKPGFNLPT
jgi:hypothetical protein